MKGRGKPQSENIESNNASLQNIYEGGDPLKCSRGSRGRIQPIVKAW